MKQRLITNAHRKITQRLRSRHEMIKPLPTQGLFNFRCHENCVQYVRDRPEESLRVVEVVYLDSGEPVLHYLVQDMETEEYLEVTLGWLAELYEFYLIRPIHPDDYNYIHSEFQRSQKDWCEEFVGWFGRKVLGIGRVL